MGQPAQQPVHQLTSLRVASCLVTSLPAEGHGLGSLNHKYQDEIKRFAAKLALCAAAPRSREACQSPCRQEAHVDVVARLHVYPCLHGQQARPCTASVQMACLNASREV